MILSFGTNTPRPSAYASVHRLISQLTSHLDGNRLGFLDHLGFLQRLGFSRLRMSYALSVEQGPAAALLVAIPTFGPRTPRLRRYETGTIDYGASAHPVLKARLGIEQLAIVPAGQAQHLTVKSSVGADRETIDDHGLVNLNRMTPIGNPMGLRLVASSARSFATSSATTRAAPLSVPIEPSLAGMSPRHGNLSARDPVSRRKNPCPDLN